MGFKNSSLLSLTLFLAISSSIHAFDVTKLLGQNPDFATFNKYLTETKLADQINSRNTITILALSDSALASISGKSQQAIKATLSVHVILDYFDEKKLVEAQGSGQLLTTLYQASGLAVNQQGFLKVALVGEGELAFGSAVSGAPLDVSLVRTVVSQPYNISILQVTKPIVVPGIDSQTPGAPSSNAQAPAAAKTPAEGAKAPVASAKAPVPTQGAKAPAQAAQAPAQNAKAAPPTEGAQTPSEEVTAPSPDESVTDSPAEAPTTIASSPSLAPGPSDGEAAAADASPPSSSSRTVVGLVGAVMCFASLLVVM